MIQSTIDLNYSSYPVSVGIHCLGFQVDILLHGRLYSFQIYMAIGLDILWVDINIADSLCATISQNLRGLASISHRRK